VSVHAGFHLAAKFIGKLCEIWASARKNVLQSSSKPKKFKENTPEGVPHQ
jgi:hypothetical protein